MYQGKTIPKPQPVMHEVHFEIDGIVLSRHALIRSTYEECRKYIKEYLDRYPNERNQIALINTETMRQVSYVISS